MRYLIIIPLILLTACQTVGVSPLQACRAYDGTKRSLAALINQDALTAAQVDEVERIYVSVGPICSGEPPTGTELDTLEDALYRLTVIEGS